MQGWEGDLCSNTSMSGRVKEGAWSLLNTSPTGQGLGEVAGAAQPPPSKACTTEEDIRVKNWGEIRSLHRDLKRATPG